MRSDRFLFSPVSPVPPDKSANACQREHRAQQSALQLKHE